MDMSVSEKTLTADSCEIGVRTVRGTVYLNFIQTPVGAHCVARSTFVRNCPRTLPRQEFLAARRLAIQAMDKVAEGSVNGLSDEDIARAVLAQEDVRTGTCSIETELDIFLKTAKWCDISRRPSIRKEIGKIGGEASSQRAESRQKIRQEEEEEKARQGDLFH